MRTDRQRARHTSPHCFICSPLRSELLDQERFGYSERRASNDLFESYGEGGRERAIQVIRGRSCRAPFVHSCRIRYRGCSEVLRRCDPTRLYQSRHSACKVHDWGRYYLCRDRYRIVVDRCRCWGRSHWDIRPFLLGWSTCYSI